MIDYEALLADARRSRRCAECRRQLRYDEAVRGGSFCGERCRSRFKSRRRYAENPAKFMAKTQAYRDANRERLLATAAEKRAEAEAKREERQEHLRCTECGEPLSGLQTKVCSPRCQERRWVRLNPEKAREREAKKTARRKERDRERREAQP